MGTSKGKFKQKGASVAELTDGAAGLEAGRLRADLKVGASVRQR
jgi:hypothetical protein